MTSTIDVNVLLYASDASSDVHDAAAEFLASWSSGPDLVYVFWPTAMSYLRIATHPSIFAAPLSPEQAAANLDGLLGRAHVRTGGEGEGFWQLWRTVTSGVVVRGNLVPDAHLVALMHQHEVRTIWSRDRDFRKFPGLRVRDPFKD